MHALRSDSPFLLALFAAFFDEVARLKEAIAQGRLGTYLGESGATTESSAANLALQVSSRLNALLQAQYRNVTQEATGDQVKAAALAQYVMAALADEIFILDPALDWSGRDAWLDVLLEQRRFKTHEAGTRFFTLCDQILRAPTRNALHAELAAVFLLALQLGFKGRYRGESGAATLTQYKNKLYRLVGQLGKVDVAEPAFPQAYAHNVVAENDARRAPMSRWRNLMRAALIGYLVLSSLVWLSQVVPFQRAFGGG